MAVRRLPATPGWMCVLNNYQNNVYIIIYIKVYKLGLANSRANSTKEGH